MCACMSICNCMYMCVDVLVHVRMCVFVTKLNTIACACVYLDVSTGNNVSSELQTNVLNIFIYLFIFI